MSDARPLYLMVKPPLEVTRAISAQLRSVVRFERLHVTLLPIGDRRDYSDTALADLVDTIGQLPFFAFRLIFDRVDTFGKTAALTASEPIEGAVTFQKALRQALAREGIDHHPSYTFAPHITLDYRGSGLRRTAPTLPISWMVEDFCLIESVHSEGRHIEHGHFALLPPPNFERDVPLAA